MKRYVVESRSTYSDIFDNYLHDYIYAENESEAIEMYKALLMSDGCGYEEVKKMEFRAKEYVRV